MSASSTNTLRLKRSYEPTDFKDFIYQLLPCSDRPSATRHYKICKRKQIGHLLFCLKPKHPVAYCPVEKHTPPHIHFTYMSKKSRRETSKFR